MSSDVIINELLCFIWNKVNTMTAEDIQALCLKCFDEDEVTAAKTILTDICNAAEVPDMDRYKRRTASNRTRKNLEDIIGMMHDLGTKAPVFVAKELHKLPPVGFDSIDVSHFLHRMEVMEENYRALKDSFAEYMNRKNGEIEKISNLISREAVTATSNACSKKNAAPTIPKGPKKQSTNKSANSGHQQRIQNLQELTESIRNNAGETNTDDDDGQGKWNLVVKKGLKKGLKAQTKTPMVRTARRGANSGDAAQKVKVAKSQATIFTSRWGLEMETQDVVDYIKSAHQLDATVSPITSKAERYKCFRVKLSLDNPSVAFEPDFWPEKIIFRRYYYRANDFSPRQNNVKLTVKETIAENPLQSTSNVDRKKSQSSEGDDKFLSADEEVEPIRRNSNHVHNE